MKLTHLFFLFGFGMIILQQTHAALTATKESLEKIRFIESDMTCTAERSTFKSEVDSAVEVCYLALIRKEPSQGNIFILHGLGEGYEKYIYHTKLLKTLLEVLKCNVFIHDHRGQGLSGRLDEDTSKAHVTQFADYLTDFSTFLDIATKKMHNTNTPNFLLAYSMGGLIATRFLQTDHECTIAGAILIAPCFTLKPYMTTEFSAWPAMKNFMGSIAMFLLPLTKIFSEHRTLNPEHSSYQGSDLNIWYSQTPSLQIKGLTAGLKKSTNESIIQCLNTLKKITVPVQFIIADDDDSIYNDKIREASNSLFDSATIETVKHATHDILFQYLAITTQTPQNETLQSFKEKAIAAEIQLTAINIIEEFIKKKISEPKDQS